MKKIAFVGAGGAGKTTLFERLRLQHMDDSHIAFIPEVARQYFTGHPDALKQRLSYGVQSKLMKLIMQAECEAESLGYEKAVCDRAVVCAPVYVAAGGDRKGSELLMASVRHWLPSYNKFYLLDPADVPFENDEIRLEAISEQTRVHETYMNILAAHGIDYEILDGSVEQRIAVVNQALAAPQ